MTRFVRLLFHEGPRDRVRGRTDAWPPSMKGWFHPVVDVRHPQRTSRYGYDILNVLITDIQPERSVLDAMNEINASRRQREAAFEKGEAGRRGVPNPLTERCERRLRQVQSSPILSCFDLASSSSSQ